MKLSGVQESLTGTQAALASTASVQPTTSTTDAEASAASAASGIETQESVQRGKPGVVVDLSKLSLEKLKGEKDSNKDIDDSSLPPVTKETLKNIRRIKKQIEEKQAELRAIEQDARLDPQTRRARTMLIQGAIKLLQSALNAANAALVKQMKDMEKDQAREAANLALK
ncbi:hypothetical protein IAE35_17175 [Pseudomonas sp. S75]|uniref:hypothetical protein n=1 Tax=unclassified Pseudomonas TaxID=196821 RepID=UPI0019069FF7|nr:MULTISPECIES: hypothetical protein [unclassified Pseudomonas]MBJ9977703.1 hypothetical protein [Pseudomonas sp. S30]MBK0155075.1 hypothetical protein [Pseudomonas sp. S75]